MAHDKCSLTSEDMDIIRGALDVSLEDALSKREEFDEYLKTNKEDKDFIALTKKRIENTISKTEAAQKSMDMCIEIDIRGLRAR